MSSDSSNGSNPVTCTSTDDTFYCAVEFDQDRAISHTARLMRRRRGQEGTGWTPQVLCTGFGHNPEAACADLLKTLKRNEWLGTFYPWDRMTGVVEARIEAKA